MKVILIFIQYYLPGYKSGGPVRTIANVVDQLGDEFEFKIICFNRDMLSEEPYDNIEFNTWNTVGKASVFYASPQYYNFINLKKILLETSYDSIYLNSFFNYKFSILPLLLALKKRKEKNIILAPRGEFSEGALALKPIKKRLYIFFTSLIGLYKDVRWQASTTHELKDIQKVLKTKAVDIHVACDLPSKVSDKYLQQFKSQKKEDVYRIIFISRICKKKNLALTIEILMSLEKAAVLDIYGTIEDSKYWEHCKDLIKKLPPHITVNYKGLVNNSKVCDTFCNYDLFLFPTLGENFGHVIFESFSSGTPVLISDRTPWRNLQEKGVGWDFSIENKQIFINTLNNHMRMNIQEQYEMRVKAFEYAKTNYLDEKNKNDNKELFEYKNFK